MGVADERPLLLVVDEAQRASGGAVELLVRPRDVAAGPPSPAPIGRRLDHRLRALPAAFLGTDDLAFDDAELTTLLGGAEHVAHLRRVTQGWPRRTGGPLARPRRRIVPRGTLAQLLDGLLAGLWLARDGIVPRGTLTQLLDGLLAGVRRRG